MYLCCNAQTTRNTPSQYHLMVSPKCCQSSCVARMFCFYAIRVKKIITYSSTEIFVIPSNAPPSFCHVHNCINTNEVMHTLLNIRMGAPVSYSSTFIQPCNALF